MIKKVNYDSNTTTTHSLVLIFVHTKESTVAAQVYPWYNLVFPFVLFIKGKIEPQHIYKGYYQNTK